MVQNIKKLAVVALALIFMLAGPNAFAGVGVTVGTINYTPSPLSVPTLSGYMLMVLALLFAIVAFRVLRAHSVGKPLASLVAAGILALAAAYGNRPIQNVQAAPVLAFSLTLSNAAGGNVFVPTPGGEGQVTNTSGVPQRINSVTGISPYAPVTPVNLPQCTVGMDLQNNGNCYVKFSAL